MEEIFKTLEIIESSNKENSKSKIFTNSINQETLKNDAIFLKVFPLNLSILKTFFKKGLDKQTIRQ